MILSELLTGARLKQPLPPELASLEIEGLDFDSRQAAAKWLFFAFPGAKADGRARGHQLGDVWTAARVQSSDVQRG